MIVCSCNVLTDRDVRACLFPGPGCPRTPAAVYRCLGCTPSCGRCAATIRALMEGAADAERRNPICKAGCRPAALAEIAAAPAV